MKDKNLIGHNIKIIRKSKKISQKELVARLNLQNINIDEPMLSRIENKQRPLYDFEIIAISKALNIPIEVLFKTILI